MPPKGSHVSDRKGRGDVLLLLVVLLLPAILALTWPKHRPEGTVVDTVGLVVVVHQ